MSNSIATELKSSTDNTIRSILEVFHFYFEHNYRSHLFNTIARASATATGKVKRRDDVESMFAGIGNAALPPSALPRTPLPRMPIILSSQNTPKSTSRGTSQATDSTPVSPSGGGGGGASSIAAIHEGYHWREEKMLGKLSGQYNPPLPERAFGGLTKRYFVVHPDTTIDVYKTREDYLAKKSTKGSRISLSGYVLHPDAALSVRERSEELARMFQKDVGGANVVPKEFTLHPTLELECGPGKRAYYFAFDTPEEYDVWVKVYTRCIDEAWRTAKASSLALTDPLAMQFYAYNNAIVSARVHVDYWMYYGGQTTEYEGNLADFVVQYTCAKLKGTIETALRALPDAATKAAAQKTAQQALNYEQIVTDVTNQTKVLWTNSERNVPAAIPEMMKLVTAPETAPRIVEVYNTLVKRIDELILLKVKTLTEETIVGLLKKGMDEGMRVFRGAMRNAFVTYTKAMNENVELWYHQCVEDLERGKPEKLLERVRCAVLNGMHPGGSGLTESPGLPNASMMLSGTVTNLSSTVSSGASSGGGAVVCPSAEVYDAIINLALGCEATAKACTGAFGGVGSGASVGQTVSSSGGPPLDVALVDVTDDAIALLHAELYHIHQHSHHEGFTMAQAMEKFEADLLIFTRRCVAGLMWRVLMPTITRIVIDMVFG
eukprot:PhF_6_TR44206/c1_g1_i2/m.67874